ncbi:hypothetical protein Leryth_015709 [Lithospermum erythrorhizon]|nr:hypothetical protein Leryth_015709 [Lithospermum erythrorhizon]
MEFFTKTKVVKLKSHLDKYLVADDDQENTRQSRSGSTRKARWIIEQVEETTGVGKNVIQTIPEKMNDSRTLWEPIKDGFLVKLKNVGGTYLRANGGTIPWRNSVTHDTYFSGSSHNWILWDVESIDISEKELLNEYLKMVSSFSSVSADLSGLDIGSPESVHSIQSPMVYTNKSSMVSRSAMDIFQTAKNIRLKSIHNKYLIAEENQETVKQDKDGSSNNSKWTIEIVQNADNIIHLKSCYNKYLTASNQPCLLGTTGKKVLQTVPNRVDSSVEWEPIREGRKVKLRTRYGQFLRANGGLPPWRNSVTYDIPQRTSTQDWVFWDVDVVEIDVKLPVPNQLPSLVPKFDSFASETSSNSTSSSKSTSFSRLESSDSTGALGSPRSGGEGRVIYFHVADKFGEYDEGEEELGIIFKGNDVGELKKKLEEVVRLNNVVVCTKSPLNGKLYPLRLKLPPNNVSMHVVLVPSSSNGKLHSSFR